MTRKPSKKPAAAKMFLDEEQPETKAVEKEEQTPNTDPVPQVTGSSVVTLPSNGAIGYPSTIEYRDILVKDEEVLSAATAQNYNRTLNGVLKSVCKDVEFFDKLSIHDRDFLLIFLWANNYSSEKEVEIECSHCKSKETHTVDFTELDTVALKDDFKQPLKIPLSQGDEGAFVRVFMSTVEHEMIVEEYIQKKGDKNTLSFEHLMMVASIDVGMPVPFEHKIKWVGENMTGREMGFVRKYHEHFRFGVNDTVDYKCGSCGEVTTGMLPFQITDIFNPSVSDDFAELLQLD